MSRLLTWLDSKGIGRGPLIDVRRLAGGTQNTLIRFGRAGRGFVLRSPSSNPRPDAARTILREARVLSALAGSAVPHPALIAECDSIEVIGAPFYITAEVDGFNAGVAMPERFRRQRGLRFQMGLSLVDGLVALAAVDPCTPLLKGFGKPEGFLDRQVSRWKSQLESYSQFPGWPAANALGNIDELADWLDRNRPRVSVSGLMHGDYHIANVLFNHGDGTLAAILDWELSTLGDPLLDLGRLLAAWPDRDGKGPLSIKIEPWEGFPDREHLIQRYTEGTGRKMDDLLWFEVLACYKLSIILEGTHARACAGLVDGNTGHRLHESAKALVSRAHNSLMSRA